VQLPPFSSLPAYTRTPSPPSTPATYSSPFRVGTPPSTTHTPSSLSTRFPVSPVSPTSYHEFPRPFLPPVTSLFGDGWGTVHHRGDTSPSENHKHCAPGFPIVDRVNRVKDHGIGEKAPRSVEAVVEGNAPLPDKVSCGWPGCVWAEEPLKKFSWTPHMYHHYDLAKPLEKKDDNRVTCMWDRCGSRITKLGWMNHTRSHSTTRFWVYCKRCNYKVASMDSLAKHVSKRHRPHAGGGLGEVQVANDRDNDAMQE